MSIVVIALCAVIGILIWRTESLKQRVEDLEKEMFVTDSIVNDLLELHLEERDRDGKN
jgi:hypothetical protein